MIDQLFFQAKVLDFDDPKMLGRIRAEKLIGMTDDKQGITGSVTSPPFNEETDKWTDRDPYIYLPLIPLFINTIPKKDELVLILYMNPGQKFVNQFYVPSLFFSPTSAGFQYQVGADSQLGEGQRLIQGKDLRNKDGSYVVPSSVGVFPEPGDNSILGRGDADVVVKEDTVLIRAGKYKGTMQPNIPPTGNTKRGFVQLSRFNKELVPQPPKTYLEEKNKVVPVKYLIEYTILNPENVPVCDGGNNLFCGSIILYQLKPDMTTNSKMTVNSSIKSELKFPVFIDNFVALSKDETIDRINNFIKMCDNESVSNDGTRLFYTEDKYPMYYRPSSSFIEQKLNSDSLTIKTNLSNIYNGVKLYAGLEPGYGLVITKNKVGTLNDVELKTYETSTYINKEVTYMALGSDYIYFLSHESSKPNQPPINFDGTLYGITGDTFVKEILPKTSSFVRGEELIELLSLIVNFLATHTHAYPGLPPVPITQDGVKINDILAKIQNATSTILNNKIRLN